MRPRSPFLPGTSGSIRAHCASVRVGLLKIASIFDLESNLSPFGNSLNEDAAQGATAWPTGSWRTSCAQMAPRCAIPASSDGPLGNAV